MKDIFKKKNFPIILFIVVSLAVYLILGSLVFISRIIHLNNLPNKFEKGFDRFYLKDDYLKGDQYMTKNPVLKDMLAGPIISKLDPSMGDKYAKVVIVEYSDFECNFCQKQEQHLKEIVAKYKYQTKLIWKDYPASDPESISYKAAQAGRCAQEQGKFWPFHDMLYEFNDNLNPDTFLKIADIVDIDKLKFSKCLNDNEVNKLIDDNIKEANALEINGVPFLYINDQEILGEASYEDIEKIVKLELAKEK